MLSPSVEGESTLVSTNLAAFWTPIPVVSTGSHGRCMVNDPRISTFSSGFRYCYLINIAHFKYGFCKETLARG